MNCDSALDLNTPKPGVRNTRIQRQVRHNRVDQVQTYGQNLLDWFVGWLTGWIVLYLEGDRKHY